MQQRPKGESHWNAKLTAQDVRMIRAEHARFMRDLMARHALSKAQLHRILANKQWAELASEEAS